MNSNANFKLCAVCAAESLPSISLQLKLKIQSLSVSNSNGNDVSK